MSEPQCLCGQTSICPVHSSPKPEPAREWWIKAYTRRWPHILNGTPTEAEIHRAYLTDHEAMIHVIEYAAFEQMCKELRSMIDAHKVTLAKVLVERDGLKASFDEIARQHTNLEKERDESRLSYDRLVKESREWRKLVIGNDAERERQNETNQILVSALKESRQERDRLKAREAEEIENHARVFDENQRLRAALELIAGFGCHNCADAAREALEGK